MFQLLLIALRNLGSHKRRTLMLGGAIAGVTALLVVLMGLSNGIQTICSPGREGRYSSGAPAPMDAPGGTF